MINVMKPITPAATLPIAFLKIDSRIRHKVTEPQPTKSADEYRFVTGGRPSSVMRVRMPAVVSNQATAISQNAERPRTSGHISHEKIATKNAAAYSSMLV